MKTRPYTVTEIAEAICEADGLSLAEHTRAHSQVRNAVRQGLLQHGEQIDRRGTLAFPQIEIYRARIINALADLSVDMVAIKDVLAEAIRNSTPAFDAKDWPARTNVNGAWHWRGFADVIAGVAAGERWKLLLSLYGPGHLSGTRLQGEFIWDGAPPIESDRSETDEILVRGAPQVIVTVDLNVLFAGLPVLSAAGA